MSVRTTAHRLLPALVFAVVVALQIHPIDDWDSWWHLATGRWIWQHGSVPTADPFAYTSHGAFWLNRQWLFELPLYGVWSAFGSAGTALAVGVLFTAALGASYFHLRVRLPAWAAGLLVLVISQAAVERFVVRPEAATFLFFAVGLRLLDERPTRLRMSAFALCQIVWANCHALSVLGVGLVVARLVTRPFVPDGSAAERREDLRLLAAGSAAAVVAECLTPFGVRGALYPFWLLRLIGNESVFSAAIVEHRPPVLGELTPPVAAGFVALLLLTGLAATLLAREGVSAIRRRLAPLAWAFGCVGLSLLARRNVALLGFGAGPLWSYAFESPARWVDRRLAERPVVAASVLTIVSVALLVVLFAIADGAYYVRSRLTRSFGLGESAQLFSPEAVRMLPAGPVFNDDLLGGYLMWAGHRQVFVDGRLQVHAPALFAEYVRVFEDPSAFSRLDDRFRFSSVVLLHSVPGRLELAAELARRPEWRVGYLDASAVVLVRRTETTESRGADGLDATARPWLGDVRTSEAVLAIRDEPVWAGAAFDLVRRPVDRANAYYNRGRAALTLLGNAAVAPATVDLEAALALWPAHVDAKLGLAYLLAFRGRIPEARALWRQVLDERPDLTVAAEALRQTGGP